MIKNPKMPQNSPMHLPEMLSFQISGETKIQPPYHGKWVSTFEISIHQANLDKCYGWMSTVAGWQRQRLAWEQLSTSVPWGWQMAGSRRQRCHRLSRGAADLAVLLFAQPPQLLPQPVELVLAGVENLWRARKCWKARQAGAISAAALGALSEKSFSAAVQFPPCSALSVLMAAGLGKRGPEEVCCLLKHPWGPKGEARLAFMPLAGPGCAPGTGAAVSM